MDAKQAITTLTEPETHYSRSELQIGVLTKIATEIEDFKSLHQGMAPKKIFVSINLIEDLLIEQAPNLTSKRSGIPKSQREKREIMGCVVYRVVEDDIIAAAP